MYLLLIAVVAGLIVLASQVNPDVKSIAQTDEQKARKMIGTILDNGAKAVFDPTLAPPTVEFVYQEVEQIAVNTLSDLQLRQLINQIPEGDYRDYVLALSSSEQIALFQRIQEDSDLNTQEQQILAVMESQKESFAQTNQTETVIKEVETSSVDLTNSDRQLGTTKICKIGNQCDISGTFVIIDNNGDKINPPYNYFFSLDCENLEWCNLKPIGINEMTEADGTWKYSTTLTGSDYLPGDYTAFARATIFKDDMNYWIEGSMIVEVVE